MDDSASSYATAGVALRVSGALKPHNHDKVETPSVGTERSSLYNFYHIQILTNNSLPQNLLISDMLDLIDDLPVYSLLDFMLFSAN
jgi:hypothetical protein